MRCARSHQAGLQALQGDVAASIDLVAPYKAPGGDRTEDAAEKVASTSR